MPKRSRKRVKPRKPSPQRRTTRTARPERDENQMAYNLVQRTEAMGAATEGKNLAAVALGRLGGLKGGRARADKLSKAERHASALKAARTRWDRLRRS